MKMPLSTPAILFPVVALLLVAYTKLLHAVSMRIGSLHAQYKNNPEIIEVKKIIIELGWIDMSTLFIQRGWQSDI